MVQATDARQFDPIFSPAEDVAAPDQESISGSEAALRRFVDSMREGTPNFDEMTPACAQVMRVQQQQIRILGQRLGKIVAVEYRGSLTETYEIFDVQHEHGTMRRRISFAPDGKVASVTAVTMGTGLTGP
jgi:hypothetical protein